MANESFVQVAQDGTGKSIRNFSITLQEADGTFRTVQMQVVNVIDEFGNVLQISDEPVWQSRMLDEIRAVRLGIQALCDYIHPTSGHPTPPTVPGLLVSTPTHSTGGAESSLIDLAQTIEEDS